MPEQESTEAPATIAELATEVTAECLVTLDLDTDWDLDKLQADVAVIVPVGSNLIYSLSLERNV